MSGGRQPAPAYPGTTAPEQLIDRSQGREMLANHLPPLSARAGSALFPVRLPAPHGMRVPCLSQMKKEKLQYAVAELFSPPVVEPSMSLRK